MCGSVVKNIFKLEVILTFNNSALLSSWGTKDPGFQGIFASPSLRRFAIHSVQNDKEGIYKKQ
jgi:hypothetical protein